MTELQTEYVDDGRRMHQTKYNDKNRPRLLRIISGIKTKTQNFRRKFIDEGRIMYQPKYRN